MTVAEIKEYIDKKLKQSREVRVVYDKHLPLIEALENIKYWLDELEDRPKGKWVKTSLSYYDDDYGYECSNCKEIYCTDYDFEEMEYNYCPNCGARMNDEVDDGSKD